MTFFLCFLFGVRFKEEIRIKVLGLMFVYLGLIKMYKHEIFEKTLNQTLKFSKQIIKMFDYGL